MADCFSSSVLSLCGGDLDEMFGRRKAVLRRGGTFRNERARARFASRPGTRYVSEDIFGWGDARPLSTLVTAAEDAGFSIISVDDLTGLRVLARYQEESGIADADKFRELAAEGQKAIREVVALPRRQLG
ncbi:hypothetical protein [Amycolatopsis pigmentata]|uniref:Uncharacterized protein n=1 Tax=Amycolatopsis pigmentata TaxID=450801 RepID=A0ABW5FK20_9PSEU